MIANSNKHGLTRYLPRDIARLVRQRCGFGCVVCGCAIYDYEHFNPPFEDAMEHDANGIALLCPTHHRYKTVGLLSETQYVNAIRNPFAIKHKMAWTKWDSENFAPDLFIGPVKYVGGTSIIDIDGKILLGFDPPEEVGAPPRLNACFFDREKQPIFNIVKNRVTIEPNSFDVETVSNRWIFRSAPSKIDLEVQLEPPHNIIIPRLKYHYDKWELDAGKNEFNIFFNGNPIIQITGQTSIKGQCAFHCDSTNGRLRMSRVAVGSENKAVKAKDARVWKTTSRK